MLNPSTLIDEMLKKSCLWHMKAWQGLPVQHNMLVASRSFSSPPSILLVFACEAQGKRPSVCVSPAHSPPPHRPQTESQRPACAARPQMQGVVVDSSLPRLPQSTMRPRPRQRPYTECTNTALPLENLIVLIMEWTHRAL